MKQLIYAAASLSLFACQSTATAPVEESPKCLFDFQPNGENCKDWELFADGSCEAQCYTIYLDRNKCPLQDLPKKSSIVPESTLEYIHEDGTSGYVFRGPLTRMSFRYDSNVCRTLDGRY